MSIYDEGKTERQQAKLKVYPDGELSSSTQEIKENVLGIARNIKDISDETRHEASDYLHKQMNRLKDTGADAWVKAERRVKSNPGQSVAIAFTAGLLASFLLARRKA